jgi:acyl-CoA synthetase (AMP-forming)/AMP-acid ligase II
MTTVRDVIETAVRRWPDRRLVFHSPMQPSETTFEALYGRGRRFAAVLWERGFRPGDVLVVRMPSWEDAVAACQAGSIIGLVLVPLIHIYRETETAFVLEQSRAKGILVPSYDEDMVRSTGSSAHIFTAPFGDLPDASPPSVELDPDDIHVLAYTSGTTAEPKGVKHTHRTLIAECASLTRTRMADDDVFFTPFPVGHIAGMMTVLVNPFLYGQTTVVMDGWDPSAALELFETERVTRSGGAPFFLQTMLDHPDVSKRDLSHVRSYGLGGAGVPPALVERAQRELGWAAFRSYGSTEHPSITGSAPDDPLEKRAYTDGRPMDGCEIRLAESGEIESRGPELFVGYSDSELDQDAFTHDGWFRTGDVGVIDADGYLTITDRIKDIVIRGGENVSAREVEEILLGMPQVSDAAVAAVPDERYGERVCAFVVGNVTLEQVREHFAKAAVAKQKWPEQVENVGSLPRTLAGKVQKYLLTSRFR